MSNPTLPNLEQARQKISDASEVIRAELMPTSTIRQALEYVIEAINDVINQVQDRPGNPPSRLG